MTGIKYVLKLKTSTLFFLFFLLEGEYVSSLERRLFQLFSDNLAVVFGLFD